MKYTKFLKQFKQLIEQTTRYIPPNLQGDTAGKDRYVDFPYVEDPEGYTTHRPLEQKEPLGFGEQSADGRSIRLPAAMKSKIKSEQAKPAMKPEEAGEDPPGIPPSVGRLGLAAHRQARDP